VFPYPVGPLALGGPGRPDAGCPAARPGPGGSGGPLGRRAPLAGRRARRGLGGSAVRVGGALAAGVGAVLLDGGAVAARANGAKDEDEGCVPCRSPTNSMRKAEKLNEVDDAPTEARSSRHLPPSW
jgi:hypothetical protein